MANTMNRIGGQTVRQILLKQLERFDNSKARGPGLGESLFVNKTHPRRLARLFHST